MNLSPQIISSIVNGVTGLSGSFLNFGASVYAVNHQAIPEPDQVNYQIVLPKPPEQSVVTPGIIALIAVMLIVLIIGLIVVIKIA